MHKLTYRVADTINDFDIEVEANSVGHAGKLARKEISRQLSMSDSPFIPWHTDSTTGGWKGIYIDAPACQHVQVPRPTPKPEPRTLPWKRMQAA